MININFLVVMIYNIFIYYINLSLAKEIIIKNDINNFYNIRNLIVENQNDDHLILNFIDGYYNFTTFTNQINFEVMSNITFVGNKEGTIFDYTNNKNGYIFLQFLENNGYVVTFQNITFQHYHEDINIKGIMIIIVFSKTDNFLVKIENCNFINNSYPLLYLEVSYNKETNKEPFYIVDNCNF